jgi:signal transduction histidine kinase
MEDGAGSSAASPPGAARRGLIELASSALVELDRVVNGGSAQPVVREVSCRELVLASLERWRPAAVSAGGIRVYWDAGPALVEGDPLGMSQAIDNLIANALEHGGPPLVVTGASVAGRLRVTVANGEPGKNGNGLPAKRYEGRRGHGVAIVSRIAAAHHGRFALCRTGTGCVAALELPLADASIARAA